MSFDIKCVVNDGPCGLDDQHTDFGLQLLDGSFLYSADFLAGLIENAFNLLLGNGQKSALYLIDEQLAALPDALKVPITAQERIATVPQEAFGIAFGQPSALYGLPD
ncbi:MAG: hypothetical protein WEF53_05120 [Bacteroidota bacterium]